MYILFHSDDDDVEKRAIAVSKDKQKLEEFKNTISEESVKFDEIEKRWYEKCKTIISEFCLKNLDALKLKDAFDEEHHAMLQEQYFRAVTSNPHLFTHNDHGARALRKWYFDESKLKTEYPKMPDIPVRPLKYFNIDGFRIEEVIEV